MFGEKGDFLVGNSSLVIMESGRFDDMDSNVKRATMASRSLGAQYFFVGSLSIIVYIDQIMGIIGYEYWKTLK